MVWTVGYIYIVDICRHWGLRCIGIGWIIVMFSYYLYSRNLLLISFDIIWFGDTILLVDSLLFGMVEIVGYHLLCICCGVCLDMIMLRMHRSYHIITFIALNVKSCYGAKPGRYPSWICFIMIFTVMVNGKTFCLFLKVFI